jgi:hypothetical protein
MKQILFVFFMLASVAGFSQTLQSSSKSYSTKAPVTIETLTKNCKTFDTLNDGSVVYVKNDMDKNGNPYYFIVQKNTKGVLARKRVYLQ